MGELVGDVLPVAVRVWTTRDTSNGEDGTWEPVPARVRKRRYPAEALVFDTETRDEASQRLLVGVWRFYRDDPDTGHHGETCIEEGFFYPDDLPERDPAGWQHLREYVAANRADDVAAGFPRQLQLRPLSWWLEHRLYRYGVRHRNRCAIVGFNLPFDFGALAQHWSPARGRYRGGWSLGLWGEFDATGTWLDRRYHPRLRLKAIDPRRTLFGWGTTGTEGQPSQDDADMRGHRRFVDLRTLTFALTDGSHTLETACAAFGDDYTKPEVTYGVINPEMLHYARQDVAHTAQLYRNCYTELGRHPGIDLQPHALYSPAGVGAAYLKAMNLTPPLHKFKKDLDPRFLGWSMSAFFGGRAEARIVRTPLPVVVADFTSMYPAINALLNTWPILTAARVTVEDVTPRVCALLDDPHLVERLFDPATWREEIGTTLVQLDNPDGVILPVRASYDPHSPDFGIGVNPLTYKGCPWYALPDVLAARLLGDAPIRITRALRLTPHGQQAGLHAVQLRGTKPVDPRQETNPFVAMIEERHRVKHATDIDPTEAKRLDQFLKITANATAYGSLARFDRRDHPDPVPVTVYGPDDEPFPDRTRHPEDPGPYCFPPLAASITAGARLILALIERTVHDSGGTYAFMDTDSIAIVATPNGADTPSPTTLGDTVRALSHEQVRDVLRKFESLNPYGDDVVNDDESLGRSPWKVEHNSLKQELWCYAIATKRYALYRPTDHGPKLIATIDADEATDEGATVTAGEEAVVGDWSEHGLGLYLDPTDDQRRIGNPPRRAWTQQAWQWILETALSDTHQRLPGWADRYAVTQFNVSTPNHTGWFHAPDTGGHLEGKPRPFAFGLLGHVDPFATNWVTAHPAAPYESDPNRWPAIPWYDRHTSQPLKVTSSDHLGHDPSALADVITARTVPLRTIGNILHTHVLRPEHKAIPHNVSTDGAHRGQLLRRAVQSAGILTAHIGKESNRLLERATGEITDPAQYRATYDAREHERWRTLVVPVLQEMRDALGNAQLARQLKISERQLRNWLNRPDVQPHGGDSGNRQRAEQFAVDWATEQLRAAGKPVPSHPAAVMYAYLKRCNEMT